MTKMKNMAGKQGHVGQPVVGEADFRPVDPQALMDPFAPVIELREVGDLKVNPRNARTHDDRQLQRLGASMGEFGFITPIIVDEDNTVLAGHGRLEAARRRGLKEVPTIQVKHLTPERKRAFMLADNRIAELAGWDDELLKLVDLPRFRGRLMIWDHST